MVTSVEPDPKERPFKNLMSKLKSIKISLKQKEELSQRQQVRKDPLKDKLKQPYINLYHKNINKG